MKRTVSRILVAVMVVSMILTAMVGIASAASQVTITGESVNIRKSASINAAIVGTVHKGDVLDATGSTAKDNRGVKWYQVKKNGKTGWVSSKYATTGGGDTPTGSYIYATGGDTYVRSTASRSGKILATMTKGSKASYLGSKKSDERGVIWYKVKYNGKTGWVSSKYTSTKKGGGSTSGSKVYATKGNTYVRNQPNLSGKILGTLKKGNSLKYLKEKSTDDRGVVWYKVSLNGTTGWVSSRYTKLG